MWECEACGNEFDEDEEIPIINSSTGAEMCLNCSYTCTHCSGSYFRDRYDDDGDEYCYNCGRRVGTSDAADAERILSYSYKPDPIFFGIGPVFLGIEHEMEVPRRVRAALGVIGEANDRIEERTGNRLFYVKRDGSLSRDGFEMVSHPMSRAWFDAHYPFDMLDNLKALGAGPKDAHGHASAGIHIHVSRDAFTTYHLYKFLHFTYEFPLLVQTVAGRFNNSYASFNKEALGSELRLLPNGDLKRSQVNKLRKLASGKEKNRERYMAVNLQNDATIELRYFRSTGKKERLKAYVQFVDALYHYTDIARMSKKAQGKRLMSEADFIAYCKENASHYPDLVMLFNRTPGYEPD